MSNIHCETNKGQLEAPSPLLENYDPLARSTAQQPKESLDILSKKKAKEKYNGGDLKPGAVRVPGPDFKSPSHAETNRSQGETITSETRYDRGISQPPPMQIQGISQAPPMQILAVASTVVVEDPPKENAKAKSSCVIFGRSVRPVFLIMPVLLIALSFTVVFLLVDSGGDKSVDEVGDNSSSSNSNGNPTPSNPAPFPSIATSDGNKCVDEGGDMSSYSVQYQDAYKAVSSFIDDSWQLDNPTTPYSKALYWMVYTDGLSINPIAQFLHFKQRYIAVLFWYTTEGVNWSGESNFLNSATHECEWNKMHPDEREPRGILECDYDKNIVKLQMYNNNLAGSLPMEFGKMSDKMESMNFSQNNIGGNIPESIGLEMDKLTRIRFSKNNFSGSLPQSFSNLSNLEFMQLYENILTGSVDFMCGIAMDRLDVECYEIECTCQFCKKNNCD